MKLFVTAIGTDCGKTVVSAILCEALKADYWKPVQTGPPPHDGEVVKSWVSYPIKIHQERYLLEKPASPHHAASLEDKLIRLSDFHLPPAPQHLVVEGAGGIFVPLNYKGEFVIDIARQLKLEIVVVIKLYLGAINHALLTLSELRSMRVPIKGLVFNGEDKYGAIALITLLYPLPILFHLQEEERISTETIKKYASACVFS
jgi:dethiobiotin synthetase